MKNPSIYLYKFLISALLCTTSTLAAAQENYKPMLVEGRSWLFRDNFCGPYDNWDKYQDYTLTVCGDTVNEGIKCKKLCLEYVGERYPLISYADTRSYFEKDGCLYGFFGCDRDNKAAVLLNFNVKVGDWSIDARHVTKIDTIQVKGRKYKRITFERCFGDAQLPAVWVEGIGYNFDCYMECTIRPTMKMRTCIIACYENGECIFEWDDFFAESISVGISNTETDGKQPQQKMYDLTGKTLKTPRKGEVYIKDGKKYVGK